MGRVRTFSAGPQDRVPRFRSRERLPARQTAPLCRLLRPLPAFDLPSSSARARRSSTFFRFSWLSAAGSSAFSGGGATSCGGATGTFSGAGTGGSVRRGVNGVFSLGMSIAMLSDGGLGLGIEQHRNHDRHRQQQRRRANQPAPRAHAHDIGGLTSDRRHRCEDDTSCGGVSGALSLRRQKAMNTPCETGASAMVLRAKRCFGAFHSFRRLRASLQPQKRKNRTPKFYHRAFACSRAEASASQRLHARLPRRQASPL